MVIVGNAMKRGNPCVEYVLENNLKYTSGPQWLHDHLLRDRWVLAISGTHGKTTTTGMLTWILEQNGLKPGFLIGGIAGNFGISARLGDSLILLLKLMNMIQLSLINVRNLSITILVHLS